MKFVEILSAQGHLAVEATHPTTLEVTKEKNLTSKGNCIIAVAASKGAADLNPTFKQLIRNIETRITVSIRVEGLTANVTGWGDPRLSLTHPRDLVIRRSNYTCPRTLMVKADSAAVNLNRDLVKKLRKPFSRVEVRIEAEL